MQDFDFDKIKYTRYRQFVSKFHITELIGFDTEALSSGKPFLFCDSNGYSYSINYLFEDLFHTKEKRLDYATWNLRYDAGAILYKVPLKVKRALWKDNEAVYGEYRLEYIPHKLLRVKHGGMTRNFWDIAPFYKSSLDAAAKKYLKDSKHKIETKTFTRSYVTKHRETIRRYCIHDAKLTSRLGSYLLRYLEEFAVLPRTLYSTATISFQYFMEHCEYIHVWRFWKKYRDLLRFSCEAYFGGKFEVTARGRFKGYEYDISSAYGSEIAALKNLDYGRVSYSRKFEPRHDYGFLRVIIQNPRGLPIPCTYKRNNLNLYPAGKFETTITKAEYEYLKRHKIPCKILEGWWIKLDHVEYPYAKEVAKLYKIKERFKKTDPMKSQLAKTMINSFYGKFVQVIEENDGTLTAGIGWNPIYGAIITANMRIRLSELQIKLGRKCLGVHTDSILTTCEMPKGFCGNRLGDWTLKEKGKGIIIACGIFQIGSKVTTRGFRISREDDWFSLLKGANNRSTLDLEETKVLSWTGQIARGMDKDINLFTTQRKRLDLNCECKRIWGANTNAKELLTNLEYSAAPLAYEG